MPFLKAKLLEEDPFHRLQLGFSLTLLGMIEQGRKRIYQGQTSSAISWNYTFINHAILDENYTDASFCAQDPWYFRYPDDKKEAFYGLHLVPTDERKDEYRRIRAFTARDYSQEAFSPGSLPTVPCCEIVFDRHKVKKITIV